MPDINKPFRGWKISQFEGGIRVPLMMKWPAKIAAGTVAEEPVAHIDVMPTLTAAAGASEPQDVIIDGENLLPLATGNGKEAWARDTLFWQSGHYRVVRHKDWKLQVTARPDKQWLFNLADDPTNNTIWLRANPKGSELMSFWMTCSRWKPSLYPPVSEQVIAIDKTLAERFEEGDEYIYWPN